MKYVPFWHSFINMLCVFCEILFWGIVICIETIWRFSFVLDNLLEIQHTAWTPWTANCQTLLLLISSDRCRSSIRVIIQYIFTVPLSVPSYQYFTAQLYPLLHALLRIGPSCWKYSLSTRDSSKSLFFGISRPRPICCYRVIFKEPLSIFS